MAGNEYPANSRYFGLTLRTETVADGAQVPVFTRRILPDPARFAVAERIRSHAGQRADVLAAESYGDAFLWWRLCDVAGVEDPAGLVTEDGQIIVLPLPLEVSDGA